MANRYKLTFEYDGTNFNGWQKQPEGRTVQEVIEKALTIFYQEEIVIKGQGRTDSGVHARAQVAHADLPASYSISRLHRALSGLLPKDVALIKAEKVNDNFHARFYAKTRQYEYLVLERPSPLLRNFSWYVFKPISLELLFECAEVILGEHDFINFCIPPDESEMTTICTINKSIWKKEDYKLTYEIEANRFLRHLVRRLVGAMIQASVGTISKEQFGNLLSAKEVNRKGHTAPAKGLTLTNVNY
ncbi:MAG: tRNA pseudouridine(38-40) synthase TruA [Balneolaceae bacterium]|nr:tRNA pseudouridine(38-40) synthase TruA [Balneolaceae bacterium]